MAEIDSGEEGTVLARARALVSQLEAGNNEEADRLLDELDRSRESQLFRELGKLTRELHDALKNFQLDSRIASLAERDIPDAKDRLSYVITMTEQSAHRTLNAVEESLPLSESIERQAHHLAAQWDRFTRREMNADEFRGLSRELSEFFGKLGEDSSRIHNNLSDVLMAQDFQDLTGQVIRRVITLVQDVEEGLVEIIRVSGRVARLEPEVPAQQEQQAQAIAPEGPQIPGHESPGVVSGQDEVDDLLASLGF